jgi:hypothetical protein
MERWPARRPTTRCRYECYRCGGQPQQHDGTDVMPETTRRNETGQGDDVRGVPASEQGIQSGAPKSDHDASQNCTTVTWTESSGATRRAYETIRDMYGRRNPRDIEWLSDDSGRRLEDGGYSGTGRIGRANLTPFEAALETYRARTNVYSHNRTRSELLLAMADDLMAAIKAQTDANAGIDAKAPY